MYSRLHGSPGRNPVISEATGHSGPRNKHCVAGGVGGGWGVGRPWEGAWAVAGTRCFKSWYELQSSSEKIRDTVKVTVSIKECHDRVLFVRISLTAFLEDRREKLKIARCMKLRRNGRLKL